MCPEIISPALKYEEKKFQLKAYEQSFFDLDLMSDRPVLGPGDHRSPAFLLYDFSNPKLIAPVILDFPARPHELRLRTRSYSLPFIIHSSFFFCYKTIEIF
jgi:hypothetical protein